ncbi:MAG: polysaccharide deacetylase family protein [Oscillospiraceae bacterium]|nr:polysaccharide deacetylase family protein [Oscillospiraceae bacterium]
MHIVVSKKNLQTVLWASAILIMSVLSLVYMSSAVRGLSVAVANVSGKLMPIYGVETAEKKIALTFNAAWGDSDLAQIIETLGKHKAMATFFVTGEWAENHPDGMRMILEAGHDIGSHSDKHPHVAKISRESLIEDTVNANRKIKEITGRDVEYYRAPYGEYNNTVVDTLQNQLGLTMIQWDADSRDWQDSITVDKITRYILNNINGGSIPLFHIDAKPKCTPPALEIILAELSKQQYSFVLLDQLLLDKNSSQIDIRGIQREIEN